MILNLLDIVDVCQLMFLIDFEDAHGVYNEELFETFYGALLSKAGGVMGCDFW